MEVDRFPNDLAARITDVDLAGGPSDPEWREILATWDRCPVLVFPDHAHLSVADHVAFLERFGPALEERNPGEKHSYVSNALGKGTDDMNVGYREGELTPHMDYTYTPYPADAISLLAEALPDGGSHTLFFSNVRALSRLPDELRRSLAGLTIRCAHDLAAMKPDARLYREARTRADAPTQSQVWPLIREHPRRRGVELLFCSMQQTERILELSDGSHDDSESRRLLTTLFHDHLYVEDNCYRHDWRLGDLVVWDNLAVQHARQACPLSAGDRSFRRVAVCEAGNAIHETVAFLGLTDSSVAFGDGQLEEIP